MSIQKVLQLLAMLTIGSMSQSIPAFPLARGDSTAVPNSVHAEAANTQLYLPFVTKSLSGVVTSATPTPVHPPDPLPTGGDDPVIAAAGDIACDPTNSAYRGGTGTASACRQKYTSDLMTQMNLAAVLPLGDNQLESGTLAAFQQSYDSSWGRLNSIVRPIVGNHEYLTTGASGYYQYFGAAAGDPRKGYYSYDIGAWHLIALNSQCSSIGGCKTGSPQEAWLRADLAAHPNKCTLAYWHIPLWSSGGRANANMTTITQDLYNAHADIILTGHDHIYERFALQNGSGAADPARGIRAFIVGTGGANHTTLATIAKNSEVRNDTTFGVLKLTLHPTSYDWKFIPEPGKSFSDSGSEACR